MLVKPAETGKLELTNRYRNVLTGPGIRLVGFDVTAATAYARICGDRSIRAPDAIQLLARQASGAIYSLQTTHDCEKDGSGHSSHYLVGPGSPLGETFTIASMDPVALLAELISLPGPPGQETAVRRALESHVAAMGYSHSTDAKGNLLVPLSSSPPKVVVTAHMDEIAMIVRSLRPDGSLKVGALGGLFPWKLGEGPVQIVARSGPIDGVLSFGSIHTADRASTVRRADGASIDWDMVKVLTGRSAGELASEGVRPGTRVVVGPQRRTLVNVGPWVAGFFLDDRADLVSWLLALEALKGRDMPVLFVASAAEEVGGEGALFVLQQYLPDVCIALELGPDVEDAPVDLTDEPTVWVNDSYSAMAASDLELLGSIEKELGLELQFQALSRGGSDASCAASHGLCARPFTLGLPMENSHGFEVMHPEAMAQLARLTVKLLERLEEERRTA